MRSKLILLLIVLIPFSGFSQKKNKKQDDYFIKSSDYSGLKFRSIGPAMISGRVIDVAVNPRNHSEYFVAAASGGVWKTEDGGITFKPVFDSQMSYSIGCVAYAPTNPHIVWVGTGENNSQRSVSRGNGVYKSEDGGKSWKNMGLYHSEHIGKILISPDDENTVFVAAQGPLWNDGGDRGLYKTTDGGKTWRKVLDISPKTGVTDVVINPENHKIMYAASYERRRHVYTLIDGGPESAIYKSEDGGETWKKLTNGLPKCDMGRIGLAISPTHPDKVYALVEAEEDKGGVYFSPDCGASWSRISKYVPDGPQYYQELFIDPKDDNIMYSMDTYTRISVDGGKTWKKLSNKAKHVDDHALWIDADNTKHLLLGGDGGLYESFNRGQTWDFKQNLPLSQFYRVSADNSKPFYFVYGGTQDNNSVGGPSATINKGGIRNADWFITHGGDGFETQIDPEDPNTVYAQSQYAWLSRYNKKTGEEIDIRPSEPDNGEAYRWNWNAPLLISPHNHTTLYFCANKVFKSTDRGNSWQVISPDLTRQIDRNRLKILGKVQRPEAVAKNVSTSVYGNLVSFTESPVKAGLLYAGSDDGQISITEDDGKTWRKYTKFPGVPDTTYVSCLLASQFDENVVYASFDNHKRGDYKPYLLKSSDKGKTWTSIAANLPDTQTVYSIAEDFKDPNLLFAGTEYGLYFTIDGGKHWLKLGNGLPNIAIRDIDIQKRECDLVLASYGRGFYILDNYSPLRELKKAKDQKDYIFPVKDPLAYIQRTPWGWRKKGHLGDNYFVADNPPYGAVITYEFDEDVKTLKEQRQKQEKKLEKEGKDITFPSFDELEKERTEIKPYLLFTIKDEAGNEVRKLRAKPQKGLHRIVWNLTYPNTNPVKPLNNDNVNKKNKAKGIPVLPGKYTVSMAKVVDGKIIPVGNSQTFTVKGLDGNIKPFNDNGFRKSLAEINRNYTSMTTRLSKLKSKVDLIIEAFNETPGATPNDLALAFRVKNELDSLNTIIYGDPVRKKLQEPYAPGLQDRIEKIVWGIWSTTEPPTQTHKNDLAIVAKKTKALSAEMERLENNEIAAMNKRLETIHSPYTPGR